MAARERKEKKKGVVALVRVPSQRTDAREWGTDRDLVHIHVETYLMQTQEWPLFLFLHLRI